MPLDRDSAVGRNDVARQTDEIQVERDPWWADQRSWDEVDFTNHPDFLDKWVLPDSPYTAEEHALARQYDAEEQQVDYQAAGEVLTDGDGYVRPEYAWLTHREPDVGNAPDPAPAYDSPEDVREALFSDAKTAAEVRSEIRDQGDEPDPEPTTDVVRTEGELSYLRGTPEQVDSERSGQKILETPDEASLGRQLQGTLMNRAPDFSNLGRAVGRVAEGFADRPPTHSIAIQRDLPVARVPDRGVEGDHVAGLTILTTVVVIKVVEALDRSITKMKEKAYESK